MEFQTAKEDETAQQQGGSEQGSVNRQLVLQYPIVMEVESRLMISEKKKDALSDRIHSEDITLLINTKVRSQRNSENIHERRNEVDLHNQSEQLIGIFDKKRRPEIVEEENKNAQKSKSIDFRSRVADDAAKEPNAQPNLLKKGAGQQAVAAIQRRKSSNLSDAQSKKVEAARNSEKIASEKNVTTTEFTYGACLVSAPDDRKKEDQKEKDSLSHEQKRIIEKMLENDKKAIVDRCEEILRNSGGELQKDLEEMVKKGEQKEAGQPGAGASQPLVIETSEQRSENSEYRMTKKTKISIKLDDMKSAKEYIENSFSAPEANVCPPK